MVSTLLKSASIDPEHGPAATPIAFIQAIVLAYQKYGINPANALRQARISAASLADPASRVTATQMEIMSGVAMQELDDEALGWFGRRLPWGTYGMLCRASLSSPNLGVALKRWCRHFHLLTDDIGMRLETSGSVATLSIDEVSSLGEMREFCLVSSIRYALGFACWAIDSRIPLLAAEFPFPAPGHQDVYPILFCHQLNFDAGRAAVSFDAQYLSLPIIRSEQALWQMLQRPLPLTVLQYRRDRLLVQRIRQILRGIVNTQVTAELIAERLHMAPRTLHRQLQQEGASLQALKNEARRDRALELLSQSKQSIKQIAMTVGFQNEKCFSRAFRQWMNQSPSEFREKSRTRA